jgi:hypothetical protein
LSLQSATHHLSTIVIETHPIQGGLLCSQTKKSRPRVAALSMPSNSAELSEAKAKAIPNAGRYTVFIKTSRKANRIGKPTAKQHLLKSQITTLQIHG